MVNLNRRNISYKIYKAKMKLVNLIPPIARNLINKEIGQALRRYVCGDVLEIGAKRLPMRRRLRFDSYNVLDILPGKGVDIVADIHRTGLKKESFDSVLAIEVLEHLYNPHKASDEIFRILKRGGTLVATTRFIYPYHGMPQDYFRFTEYGLREIFKGYSEVKIIPQGSWLINLWDSLTYSAFLWPLRILNPVISLTNNRKTIFPSGFIIIARK